MRKVSAINLASITAPFIFMFMLAFVASPVSIQAQQTPAASAQKSATPPKPAAQHANKPAQAAPAKPAEAATAAPLATEKQKDSYALGMSIGKNLSSQSIDLDVPTLLQGLQDALQGGKTQMTDDEMKATLTQLSAQVSAKQQAAAKAAAEANVKEGQDFLASNKSKEGVVVLPSGLQYKVITMGTGAKPGPTDTVVCDYRGTLINGKEFDSSYKRGQPASFPVNRVIKGWTEALQLMPVGSKWQLFIPPDLAYGANGAGADIGPNSTLIFEVELHAIQGK